MFEAINWLGIILATVVSMAIGAGWYSGLAKPWIAANGFTEEQVASVEANDQPWIYGVAIVCHIIMAIILAGVIFHSSGAQTTIGAGLLTAFLIWLGFIVTSMSVNHRFQMKPWSLTIIDSGHYLLVLLAQGAIIGWFGFN